MSVRAPSFGAPSFPGGITPGTAIECSSAAAEPQPSASSNRQLPPLLPCSMTTELYDRALLQSFATELCDRALLPPLPPAITVYCMYQVARISSIFIERQNLSSIYIERQNLPSIYIERKNLPSIYIERKCLPSLCIERKSVPSPLAPSSGSGYCNSYVIGLFCLAIGLFCLVIGLFCLVIGGRRVTQAGELCMFVYGEV